MGIKDLSELFNRSHLNFTSFSDVLLFIAYLPFGILLLLIRIPILLLAVLLIYLFCGNPPFFLIKIFQFLLGIVVVPKNYLEEYQNVPIICCNHMTPFDVFPFISLFKLSVLVDKGFFESSILTKPFLTFLNAVTLIRSQDSKEVDKENILKQMKSGIPLLFFPEGWDTNGKKGLLIYQKWMFSLKKKILPVTLKVSVPYLPIQCELLGTSILKETLWLLFSPCYYFEINFLTPQCQKEGEEDLQFSRRIQEMTALSLGIEATNWSFKDALEFRKTII